MSAAESLGEKRNSFVFPLTRISRKFIVSAEVLSDILEICFCSDVHTPRSHAAKRPFFFSMFEKIKRPLWGLWQETDTRCIIPADFYCLSLSFQWQRRGSQDRIQNLLPQYDCTIISLINPPVGVYRGEVNVNGVSCRPEGLLRPSNHQQCSAEGKVSTPCKKTILLEHPDLSLSLSLSLQRKIIKYPEE